MATLEEVRARAEAALAAGNRKTAFSLGLLMQRHFPRDYQTSQLLGKVYLNEQRIPEALELFHNVLEVDPEDVVTRSALAMIAEMEGDTDGALEHFERAFDIDPGNHEIASEIARLRSQLRHSKPQEPGSPMHSMARRFLIEGKYESAVPWLQEALRITPNVPEIAVGLARALWLSWRPTEAEEVAREVLAEHPHCLRALAVLAGADYSKGGAGIVVMLDRTAELNPSNSVARALFTEAGIMFPDRTDDLSIPDEEIEAALSAAPEGLADTNVSSSQPSVESEVRDEAEDAGPQPETVGDDSLQKGSEDQTGHEEEPLTGAPEPEAEKATSNPLLRRLAALKDDPAEEDEPIRANPSWEQQTYGPPRDTEPTTPVESGTSGYSEETPAVVEETVGIAEVPSTPNARDHLEAAADFADQGLLDLAISEYRDALRADRGVAPDVGEAVLALAEANPGSVKARWLAGDALALDGKFRKAVEQYIQVLKSDAGDQSTPDPSTVHWQD